MSVGFTGVEIHSFSSLSNACSFMDQGFQSPRATCVDKSFPNDFCILNACLTNSLTQRLWIQNFELELFLLVA